MTADHGAASVLAFSTVSSTHLANNDTAVTGASVRLDPLTRDTTYDVCGPPRLPISFECSRAVHDNVNILVPMAKLAHPASLLVPERVEVADRDIGVSLICVNSSSTQPAHDAAVTDMSVRMTQLTKEAAVTNVVARVAACVVRRPACPAMFCASVLSVRPQPTHDITNSVAVTLVKLAAHASMLQLLSRPEAAGSGTTASFARMTVSLLWLANDAAGTEVRARLKPLTNEASCVAPRSKSDAHGLWRSQSVLDVVNDFEMVLLAKLADFASLLVLPEHTEARDSGTACARARATALSTQRANDAAFTDAILRLTPHTKEAVCEVREPRFTPWCSMRARIAVGSQQHLQTG